MDQRLSPKDLPRAQLFVAAVAVLGVLLAKPVAAASTTRAYSAQLDHLFGISVDGLTLLGDAVLGGLQLAQTLLFKQSQQHLAALKIGKRDAAFRDGLLAARVAEDG